MEKLGLEFYFTSPSLIYMSLTGCNGNTVFKKKKKKSCSKSSTENVKMPWDSQRLKMGKKGAENIPLSLSFFVLQPGEMSSQQ